MLSESRAKIEALRRQGCSKLWNKKLQLSVIYSDVK